MREFESLTKLEEFKSLVDGIGKAALPEGVCESFRKAALLEVYALAVSTTRRRGHPQSLADWAHGEAKSMIDPRNCARSGVNGEYDVRFDGGDDVARVYIQETPIRKLLGLPESGRQSLSARLSALFP